MSENQNWIGFLNFSMSISFVCLQGIKFREQPFRCFLGQHYVVNGKSMIHVGVGSYMYHQVLRDNGQT